MVAEVIRAAGQSAGIVVAGLFVTQQQLAQTMGRVLTNVQDKMYLPDRADGKPRELRLLLNRETPKPAPASP